MPWSTPFWHVHVIIKQNKLGYRKYSVACIKKYNATMSKSSPQSRLAVCWDAWMTFSQLETLMLEGPDDKRVKFRRLRWCCRWVKVIWCHWLMIAICWDICTWASCCLSTWHFKFALQEKYFNKALQKSRTLHQQLS